MAKCVAYAGEIYSSAAKKILEDFERSGALELVGITADKREFAQGYDLPFVDRSSLEPENTDAVIVLSQDRERERGMEKSLMEAGIPYERIVPVSVMKVDGFDFGLYRKLRAHTPTIFTQNCMGGLIYRYLELPFMSPFISAGFPDKEDYLRFLSDPERYLNAELSFGGFHNAISLGNTPPTAVCEDTLLLFAHYPTYEEGVKKWNERKTRIDWNNLVVIFNSDNVDIVRRFTALPYKRKVCFTGAKITGPSIVASKTLRGSCMEGSFLRNAVNDLLFMNNSDFNMFRFLAGEDC